MNLTSETGRRARAPRQMTVFRNSGSYRVDLGAILRRVAKERTPIAGRRLTDCVRIFAVPSLALAACPTAAGVLTPAEPSAFTVSGSTAIGEIYSKDQAVDTATDIPTVYRQTSQFTLGIDASVDTPSATPDGTAYSG